MKRLFITNKQVQQVLRDNRVDDIQIRQMEIQIMNGGGDTVANTAGIKKIRCGAEGRGKRGGIRVLFADYPEVGKTYLLSALTKGQRANFSKEELKILQNLKRQLDALHEV